jgi:hypothetical protein
MALSDAEIEEIKFFLGYTNLTTVALAYFDIPAIFTTVVQGGLSAWAEAELRDGNGTAGKAILPALRQLQVDIQAARKRYKADEVGSIKLNRKEHGQLLELREFWVSQLERITGVKRHPDSSGAVFTEVY